jgi:hypothetical protein
MINRNVRNVMALALIVSGISVAGVLGKDPKRNPKSTPSPTPAQKSYGSKKECEAEHPFGCKYIGQYNHWISK